MREVRATRVGYIAYKDSAEKFSTGNTKLMQDLTGERGGYLHGRGALDSDDLLYFKEQMEAEEDAERFLPCTEKRAFQAFKISFCLFSWILSHFACVSFVYWLYLAMDQTEFDLHIELLRRFGFIAFTSRQIIALVPFPFRFRPENLWESAMRSGKSDADKEKETLPARSSEAGDRKIDNPVKTLLSVYESSDDDD
ncbi:hypothetical protein RND71_029997 [Anisodus tanguticus]|uniref:Uncharacterized protein n=1 Tax=Anisodus tanguticus TaxID=243964 RepID=A0AAE1REE4_9SOLA|nr:hypothetical protein RND71_029997 [Anisodus tanguticus]